MVTGLQVLISNLRRSLEPDRPEREPPQVLVTRPAGYLLVVEAHQLDAARFEALVTSERRLLEGGEPAAAVETLTDAIADTEPALAIVARNDANEQENVEVFHHVH